MTGESLMQKVKSLSQSNSDSGRRRSMDDTHEDVATPRGSSLLALGRWTNNPIYKHVPAYALAESSSRNDLHEHEKLIKRKDMIHCWTYRSQHQMRNGVRVSLFNLDVGVQETRVDEESDLKPMELLVVWPHKYAKRLRRSDGVPPLFEGFLAHCKEDCIPVLIRRAKTGQRVHDDLLPFVPSRQKAAAVVFDPHEWVVQHRPVSDIQVDNRDGPYISSQHNMWGLLSPKALLSKHDYICWDESNHNVSFLIGRSWVKTAQWTCEHELHSHSDSEDDVIGPQEIKFTLQHFMDLSGDLEATVVMTSVDTGMFQESVSFLSDAGAILVLVSKSSNEDKLPLAAIVMKAVKSEQRILCQYDANIWHIAHIPPSAPVYTTLQHEMHEGVAGPCIIRRLIHELGAPSFYITQTDSNATSDDLSNELTELLLKDEAER